MQRILHVFFYGGSVYSKYEIFTNTAFLNLKIGVYYNSTAC